jgi:hypothetical protein
MTSPGRVLARKVNDTITCDWTVHYITYPLDTTLFAPTRSLLHHQPTNSEIRPSCQTRTSEVSSGSPRTRDSQYNHTNTNNMRAQAMTTSHFPKVQLQSVQHCFPALHTKTTHHVFPPTNPPPRSDRPKNHKRSPRLSRRLHRLPSNVFRQRNPRPPNRVLRRIHHHDQHRSQRDRRERRQEDHRLRAHQPSRSSGLASTSGR